MPRHPPCTLYSLISFMWVILEEIVFFIYPLRKNFKISFFFTHHCFALFNFQIANFKFEVRNSKFEVIVNFHVVKISFHSAFHISHFAFKVVGLSGLEPPTSRLSGVRSNRLSYKPILVFGVSRLIPTVVEMRRIELLTSCLQGRRSPSWATPP